MKLFQGFTIFLLLTFAVLTILQGVQADNDICTVQCQDANPAKMCGDMEGKKVTYPNSCLLDCKGKIFIAYLISIFITKKLYRILMHLIYVFIYQIRCTICEGRGMLTVQQETYIF